MQNLINSHPKNNFYCEDKCQFQRRFDKKYKTISEKLTKFSLFVLSSDIINRSNELIERSKLLSQ